MEMKDDIRLVCVTGYQATGYTVILEVNGGFYRSHTLDPKPVPLNVEDKDGKVYHLTRESVRQIKRFRRFGDARRGKEIAAAISNRINCGDLEKIGQVLNICLHREFEEMKKGSRKAA